MADNIIGSTMGSTRSSQLKVIVCIPCYNTAFYIADVVTNAKKYVDEVIVIDDGSSDDTADIATAVGAQVVIHETNKGYGQSIKSGFEVAKSVSADILVTLDGDGQHNPDEIPQIVSPILNGEADLVIGSRFLSKNNKVPKHRRLGINIITFLCNLRSGEKVSDAQSGFRAYSKKVINELTMNERGMGISVELLIRARQNGFHIKEAPITCLYHSDSSTLHPIGHGVGVAATTIKYQLIRKRLTNRNGNHEYV